MKIAIIHDWLNGMRGGEKVLEILCALLPDADLFCLVCEPDKISPLLRGKKITTSFIQKLPGSPGRYRSYLPLFPSAIESFDLRSYDVLLSTSHCVAKGALPGPGARHLCYCFTPMRYIWDGYWEYLGAEAGLLKRLMAPWVSSHLRTWDVASCPRVDRFLAISHYVASRIRRYYGRESSIVFPPVDTEFFTPGSNQREDFLLCVSALVPYKRLELGIALASSQKIPLRIVGTGPEEKRLRALAGKGPVTFLDHVSAEDLRGLYRRCRAFLMPGLEDFGLVPVEAQACGAPVIALKGGGALDIVEDAQTGLLFEELTLDSLTQAWKRLQTFSLDPEALRASALRFSEEQFKRNFMAEFESLLSAGGYR